MTENVFLISLISFLPVIPASALCAAPMKEHLKVSLKRLSLRLGLCCAVSMTVSAWLSAQFSVLPVVTFIPMVAVMFIIYHLSLNVHIAKSLAIVFFVSTIMAIFSNTSIAIDALTDPDGGAYRLSMTKAFIRLVICSLAALGLFPPMRKYGSFLVARMNSPKPWFITAMISGIVLVTNIFMSPIKYETLYMNNVFRIYWTLQLTFLTLEILLAVIFYYIVVGMLDSARIEQKNRFLEMQESQYIKQQKYIEDTARARHDFRQTVRTLNAMAIEDDIDGIKNYLRKYTSKLPEKDTVSYCKNSAVNALLNYYTQVSLRHGIMLDWCIDLPELDNIDDNDLCTVIGNILDNAVYACRDTDGERYIQLTVTVRNSANLYIVAVNSFNGKVRQKDGRYYSTSRKGSGIGLSSISSIAEGKGGTAVFHHDGNEFYSDVMIPVKLTVKT